MINKVIKAAIKRFEDAAMAVSWPISWVNEPSLINRKREYWAALRNLHREINKETRKQYVAGQRSRTPYKFVHKKV